MSFTTTHTYYWNSEIITDLQNIVEDMIIDLSDRLDHMTYTVRVKAIARRDILNAAVKLCSEKAT